jgi:hypothetical protein
MKKSCNQKFSDASEAVVTARDSDFRGFSLAEISVGYWAEGTAGQIRWHSGQHFRKS